MKVNFTNPYRWNRKPLNNNQQGGNQKVSVGVPLAKHSVEKMSCTPSFCSKIMVPEGILKIRPLTELEDLPCIYCAKKMISRKTFDSISWPTEPQFNSLPAFLNNLVQIKKHLTPYEKEIVASLAKESEKSPRANLAELLKKVDYQKSENIYGIIYKRLSPTEYSEKAIKLIKKFEDCLPPVESTVLKEIEVYHAKHPEATLHEIMLGLRPKHLKSLTQKQMHILNGVELLAQNLPTESKDKILKATAGARKAVTDDNSEDPFKRKKITASITTLTRQMSEKKVAAKIQEKIQELPNSSNSVDAFIVKYSGKVQIQEKEEVAKNLEKDLSAAEAKVFEEIKAQYHTRYPDKTTQEIINIIYPEHLKILTQAQSQIVEKVNTNVKNISAKLTNMCLTLTNGLREKIANHTFDYLKEKQYLIDGIKSLRTILDEESMASIFKVVEEMPCANNDMNAFIVKYHDKFNIDSTNPLKYELEKYLTTKEKATFNKVKGYYSKPETKLLPAIINQVKSFLDLQPKTLQKRIDESYPQILSNLAKNQLAKLDKIDKAVQNIAEKIRRNALTNDFDKKSLSEKQLSIEKLKRVQMPLTEGFSQMVLAEPISKLPSSKNDISAFVVKYFNFSNATETNNVKYVERTEKEIGQSLLQRSVMSVEHLASKISLFYGSSLINEPKNLVYAHAGCNGEKGHTHLFTHIKSNPEIIQNPQAQIDFIISQINNGTLKGLDNYPVTIKNTLFDLSGGLIDLDTSRLNGEINLPMTVKRELLYAN